MRCRPLTIHQPKKYKHFGTGDCNMTTKTKSKNKSRKKTNRFSSPKKERRNRILVTGAAETVGFGSDFNWDQWTRHLAGRGKPQPIDQTVQARGEPSLLWSVTEPVARSTLLHWIEKCSAARAFAATTDDSLTQVCDVISEIVQRRSLPVGRTSELMAADEALLLVGASSILPSLARIMDRERWCQILDQLISISQINDAQTLDIWTLQLLAIELPLTLAYQLPELPHCAALGPTGARQWDRQVDQLVDGDGWISSRHLALWRPLLATWSRSWYLIKALEVKGIRRKSQLQWEWLLRQSMRLMRKDGSQLLTDQESGRWCSALFRAALRTTSDESDRRIARFIFPSPKKKPSKLEQLDDDQQTFSEWAGLGVLSSGWGPKRPRVAVAVDGRSMQLEICRGTSLLRGLRSPEISIDGRQSSPQGDWELVCHHTDNGIDYLEWEMELDRGVRLQRQLLLLRQDSAVLLADIVLGDSAKRIDYRLQLELPDGISVIHETETSEIYLADPKIRSLVIPVALPEWQAQCGEQGFDGYAGHLQLTQSVAAKNLYAGIFLDLRPRRSLRPRTWRPLTVAEQLRSVSREIAVAFRIQIGKQQWVLYRAIDAIGNRTFMGQNHSSDFFIGKLRSDGNVDEILSIE